MSLRTVGWLQLSVLPQPLQGSNTNRQQQQTGQQTAA